MQNCASPSFEILLFIDLKNILNMDKLGGEMLSFDFEHLTFGTLAKQHIEMSVN